MAVAMDGSLVDCPTATTQLRVGNVRARQVSLVVTVTLLYVHVSNSLTYTHTHT